MMGVQSNPAPLHPLYQTSKDPSTASSTARPHHSPSSTHAMVSVCATCKGLEKHVRSPDGTQDTDAGSLLWINTSLPALRTSAAGCRACTLLLQGILLHHYRFAGIDEASMRITAETFQPTAGLSLQDHLSVDVRWQEQDAHDECQDDGDEHAGYPDLKLEFFTDGGTRPVVA
jgi:hypothetical protein